MNNGKVLLMTEVAFKSAYSKGYIDADGYVLKSMPVGEYEALDSRGMLKRDDKGVRLRTPTRVAKALPEIKVSVDAPATAKEVEIACENRMYGILTDASEFERFWDAPVTLNVKFGDHLIEGNIGYGGLKNLFPLVRDGIEAEIDRIDESIENQVRGMKDMSEGEAVGISIKVFGEDVVIRVTCGE